MQRRVLSKLYDAKLLRPGDKVLLEGQKYFVAGMQNNGAYVRLTNGKAYSLKKARFSLSKERKDLFMTVREAVRKELGGLTAGKHAYRIGFIDVHKQEQETELDTDSVRDLEELWASIAPEFECAEDSITYMAPAFENDPENDFNKDFL